MKTLIMCKGLPGSGKTTWAKVLPIVRSFPLSDLESVLSSFEHIKPLEQEGYVIVDGDFRRIKVKHPGYVALHHLRDSLSPKRVLDVIRRNESSEALLYFPEWRPVFEQITERYGALCYEIEQAFSTIRDTEIQKDFAGFALQYSYSGVLFALRSGKSRTIQAALRDMQLDKLADLLNLSEVSCEVNGQHPRADSPATDDVYADPLGA